MWSSSDTGYFSLPDNTKIKVSRVLVDDYARSRGLSGVKSSEFADDEGAIFIFPRKGMRTFWMPNTFFDLDIIYLDDKFKILSIDRNVKHHKSYEGDIPKATPTIAWHVLEIKARTALSKKLNAGMVLKWTSQPLEQKAPKTRHSQ